MSICRKKRKRLFINASAAMSHVEYSRLIYAFNSPGGKPNFLLNAAEK